MSEASEWNVKKNQNISAGQGCGKMLRQDVKKHIAGYVAEEKQYSHKVAGYKTKTMN